MTPTYLLAIESSGRAASVALGANSPEGLLTCVAERILAPDERTAKELVPAISALLSSAGVTARQLTTVAVTIGPGSFTGLRIGVTAAKTVAYATSASLVGVSTLDVLALQSKFLSHGRVWAIVDAQRGDLFAGEYTAADCDTLGENDRTQLLAADDWIAKLAPGDVAVGPCVDRYSERLPSDVQVPSADACAPLASTVLQLGSAMAGRDLVTDPFQLVPRYHRPSAAEEKATRT